MLNYEKIKQQLLEFDTGISSCKDIKCPIFCNSDDDCIIYQAIEAIKELASKVEKLQKEKHIAIEQLHHCENSCDYCTNRNICDKEDCFSFSPITQEPSDYWQWDINA